MRKFLQVLTPAASLDLTILANAKEHLGITGGALDTKIQTWIKQASDAIASHCSRVFGQETVKETFFITCETDALVLDRFPVSAITSVLVDGVALTSADHVCDHRSGILSKVSRDTLINWRIGKVEVTYVGGYLLLPDLPYDLEQACLKMVQYSYSQSGRDMAAKRIEIPGVQTVDYWVGAMGKAGELPPDVAALVGPYVSMRI
jgi:uncharacterized phiE125 gp8 family phage protein